VLLKAGANIEARDIEYGCTPLIWAAENGHDGIVEVLLKAGADTEVQGIDGAGALHLAAAYGSPEIVKKLLEAKSDAEAQDEDGRRPLHFAAMHGQSEIVRILLRARVDVHAQTKDGYKPLHLAACNGHIEIADDLVSYHMDTVSVSAKPMDSVTLGSACITLEDGETITNRIQMCLRLVNIFPQDYILRGELANVYLTAQKYALAVASFDVAMSLDPINSQAICIDEVIHHVCCDNCACDPIQSYRNKCTICPDYDLCETCFHTVPNPHPDHEFIKIPSQKWIENLVRKDMKVREKRE
jgi:hypothetical protein